MILKEKKTVLPLKTRQNRPQKLLIIGSNFFQYCQQGQTQRKSQFLSHKNCSTRNLCKMTLLAGQAEPLRKAQNMKF